MISLTIIISQIILKDYGEIRIGMIISSLIFIILLATIILSLVLDNIILTLSLLFFIGLGFIVEDKLLPKLWKTRKIKYRL